MFRRKYMLDRSILELEADKRDKLIIDIRRKEEYEKDTYPDAINIYNKLISFISF